MVLATWWGWSTWPSVILAVVLAFFFGYLLTFSGVRRAGLDVPTSGRVLIGGVDSRDLALASVASLGAALLALGFLGLVHALIEAMAGRSAPRSGVRIPTRQIAEVNETEGPNQIVRENSRRHATMLAMTTTPRTVSRAPTTGPPRWSRKTITNRSSAGSNPCSRRLRRCAVHSAC